MYNISLSGTTPINYCDAGASCKPITFSIEGGILYPSQPLETVEPSQFWAAIHPYCSFKTEWNHLHLAPGERIPIEMLTLYASFKLDIPPTDLIQLKEQIPLEELGNLFMIRKYPLHLAICLNSIPLMEEALQKNVSSIDQRCTVNSIRFRKLYPLSLALIQKNAEAFEWLLKKGASWDAFAEKIYCPLLNEFKTGGTLGRLMIQHGYLEWKARQSEHRRTSVHIAAMNGLTPYLKFLLENGASVDPVDANGDTPLAFAIRKANSAETDLLLSHEADPIRVYEGRSLLAQAIRNFPQNSRILDRLINGAYSLNEEEAFALIAIDRIDRFIVLAEKKMIDLSATDANGLSFMHYIVKRNKISTVNYLLSIGCSSSHTPRTGITPLHIAALRGYTEIALALINAGADQHAKDYLGWTPEKLLEINPCQNASSQPPVFFPYAEPGNFDEPLLRKEKELKKLLGLAFDRTGYSPTPLKEDHDDTEFVNLEGLAHDQILLEKAVGHLQDLQTYVDIPLDQAIEMCTFSAKGRSTTSAEYLERIQAGKPTLIYSGFSTHSVEILIWGENLVICNRGAGRLRGRFLEFYTFDNQTLTIGLVDKMRSARNHGESQYTNLFKEITKNLASPPYKKESAILQTCHLKLQTVGNCTFANLEAALWMFFALQQDPTEANEFMAGWRLYTQLNLTKEYLDFHTSGQSPYYPDMGLCQAALLVLEEATDKAPIFSALYETLTRQYEQLLKDYKPQSAPLLPKKLRDFHLYCSNNVEPTYWDLYHESY